MIERLGYVSCERVAKETCPRSIYRAHRVWRYSPKPAVMPAHMITKMPRKMPILERAEGMASRPAPRTANNQHPDSRYKGEMVSYWCWRGLSHSISMMPGLGIQRLSCLVHACFCQPLFYRFTIYILTVFLAVSRYSRTWGLPQLALDRWRSTLPSLPVLECGIRVIARAYVGC
jgi:hypothetical protein